VDFTEFKRKIDGGDADCIYLIEGEEVYLKEKAVSTLKDKFVSFSDLDYVSIDGEDVSIDSIVPLCTAFPFMSQKRLVVIRDFYPKADQIKGALKDVFVNPSPSTIVAIVNSKPCDQLKKQKTVTHIDCRRQSSAIVSKWIKREFLQANVDISTDLCIKIAEYSLMDMTKIDNEVKKLLSFIGDASQVTENDVELVVSKDSVYHIYKMTDYIAQRNFNQAMLILEELLSSGEAPQKLFSSIYYYYRQIFHVALSPDKPDKELASMLGAMEFVVTKIKKQIKFFKLKSLKKAVDTLADLDYKQKSGELGIDSALMLGVFKIMTE
jgi:DNA polymerase-3 subunit delta